MITGKAQHALTLFALIWFLFTACTGVQDDQRQPNIIFILADDLGWADLPLYGNKFNEAPNISRLAREGMWFRNAYAAGPVCSPTRASIISGQYPARVGVTDFIKGHNRPYEKLKVLKNRTQYLPLEVYTMGEAMKAAGYTTAYFGKWHLGGPEYYPEAQGFDEQVVFEGGKYFDVGDRLSSSNNVDPDTYLSDLLTDLGLNFIEKNKSKPFLLFLSHYNVHVQLDADSALIQKYLNKEKVPGYPSNAVYAAMIEHLDNSVGAVMKQVDELNLSDHTLIVFFSDNGGLVRRGDGKPLLAESKRHLYAHDSLLYVATSNTPLRREKGTLYEGGIRVPLVARFPGKIKPGTISDALVSSVDFLPTFVDLAGGELPESEVFDGKSILPELTDHHFDAERTLFWHYPHYHHDVPSGAIRQGDYKLIEFYDDDHVELYDLRNDIGEAHDLAATMPDKVNALSEKLSAWRHTVKAVMPGPNPEFDPAKRYKMGR